MRRLCADIWEGNDYVPDQFPLWIRSPTAHVYGIDEGEDIVAICALESIPGTGIAWVEGLRVSTRHEGQGLATQIVKHVVSEARRSGLRLLRYATGSRNVASQRVAEKTGFAIATRVGYLKIEHPYPPHPTPSPNILPLTISPERLYHYSTQYPDLLDTERVPLAWMFEDKSVDGLKRLGERTEFRAVIGEDGTPEAVYFYRVVGRGEQRRAAYTVYAIDRTAFVDVMARVVEESAQRGIHRIAVFLGKRAKEWSKYLGYVDKEYENRYFILYEQSL